MMQVQLCIELDMRAKSHSIPLNFEFFIYTADVHRAAQELKDKKLRGSCSIASKESGKKL